MFYVKLYGHEYPVLSVQPIIEKDFCREQRIVRTEFLIPAIPYEGVKYPDGEKFIWIDANMVDDTHIRSAE